ncbi:redoxin domain-containing protein [uncultured Draconibacterium sp.]|uniref:peroxiredoxin family protein n=1 Tax=uncultured Draconibacterium sp. TaxID=1573823 RepID=UPI002AA77120|nr:redoxin domain-containing protein [uncultured Draconibacterium sp.]
MKRLFPIVTILLFTSVFCKAQKQELVQQVISAIKKTEGATYESTSIIQVSTPADTIMTIKFLSKFTYMINEYDSLYQMNFRYDKREKTYNFDRLKSLVYNGQYFYSVEKIEDNQIPDPSYRIQDITKSSGKIALQNSIEGQLPFVFKNLTTKTSEEIIFKSDSVFEDKQFHRLAFMTDPIYEFEVWIDNETKLPSRVVKIAHINRNKPQIIETNEFNNFQFFKNESGEIVDSYFINQFSVNENSIQLVSDNNRIIPTHLKNGKSVPELNQQTVLNSTINITPSNQKVKLMYFGMINCCPCIKSIPHLKKINSEFKENAHFEIMAFYPYDPPSILKKYVKKEELTFPVCAGGKEVVAAFGLHSYPDMLLTDKEGKVYKWYNYSEDMDTKIIAEINQLLQ